MEPTPKRLPIDDTRQLLLQTGYDLLMGARVRGAFDVRLRDVVEKANRTTGSAYQIWGSQDDYRRDLALFVAETVEYADPAPIGELLAPLLENPTSMEQVVRSVGETYFDYFFGRPEFAAFLRLGSITRPEPEVAEAVLRGYDNLHELLSEFLSVALMVEGKLRIRDDAIDFAPRAVTALTEGFALKARFAAHGDPDRAQDRVDAIRDDYIESLLALTRQLTEPIDPG
jgi:AcrR family transcriptional regulator